jgi:hypothetical protein
MCAAMPTTCGLPLGLGPDAPRRSPWAIVLAGGDGQRMRPTIRRWLGEERPKQFCTFTGTRSMLQHTLDRTLGVVAPQRVVTVIRDGQQRHLHESLRGAAPGHILVQPRDAGTAAAVFAALAAISDADEGGTVLVLPSDHFVYPERPFLRDLVHACLFAEQPPERLVLLGAPPEEPEEDYGWIGPGPADVSTLARFLGRAPAGVRDFVEKPDAARARALQGRGYLWNTGIAAGRARTLWALGRAAFGPALDGFDALRRALGAIRTRRAPAGSAAAALHRAYEGLGPLDFSRGLCPRAAAERRSLVLPLGDVRWSDWGRPERILASIARLGRRTSLPAEEPSPPQALRA